LRSGMLEGYPVSLLDDFPKINAIVESVRMHPVVSSYYDGKDGKLYAIFRKPEAKAPIELGYWAIRGLGAPLRMMCEYAGVRYEDKQYTSGEEWFEKDKPRVLDLNPLANLPYVIVNGETCVCQTSACLMFLGERFGMNGTTMKEKVAVKQLLDEIYDLRNKMVDLAYPFKKVNRTKEEYEGSAESHLNDGCPAAYKKLEAWLVSTNTKFFISNQISTPDFHIWEMVDQHEKLAKTHSKPSPVQGFPKLKVFHEAVKAEPKLAAYFASPSYELPCNSPMGSAYFV